MNRPAGTGGKLHSIHYMKTQNTLIAAVAMVLSGLPLAAQNNPQPLQAQPAPVQRPAAGMFGMLDANKDGFLVASEIEKMVERRFSRMDVNGDGSLTAAEMQAARKGPMGGQGGGGL